MRTTVLWVDESTLPDDVRALFHPAASLPDDVQFFSDRTPMGAVWWVGGGFGALLALASVNTLTAQLGAPSGFDRWLGLGIALAIGGTGLALVRAAWQAHDRDKQQLAGTWRYGIYLLPDALVVRLPNTAALVARERFAGVRSTVQRTEHNTQRRILTLAYLDDDGTERTAPIDRGWRDRQGLYAALERYGP
jgi:hypothetical protein